MRKLLLSILAVGVLAPSLAMAANTTYVFRYQATGGSTIPGVAQNAATANFSLSNFYPRLAADVPKCADLSSTGKTTFSKTVIGFLKKLASVSGDTTFSDGYITTPGAGGTGAVSGEAYFNGFSGAAGLTNSGILNAGNTASAALLCGGAASGSGVGACGNGTLCKSGALAGGSALTDCSQAGQTNETVNAPNPANVQAAHLTVFVYPYAGSLCNTPKETLAECCGDPNLVIITSNHSTLNNDHNNNGATSYSTVSSQGTGGYSEAYAQ